MKADEICRKAGELVSGDRQKSHGDKVENHRNIAAFWQTYIACKYGIDVPLSALDAANMMEALKIARRCTGEHNPDDYVDGAGYAAVAGEIASE